MLGDPGDERLGRLFRPSLRVRRALWLLGPSPTPRPARLESEPPGRVPWSRTPAPPPLGPPNACQTLPGAPRLSSPSFPARRRSPAPSWRRSWRPASPPTTHRGRQGRGAVPAPRACAAPLCGASPGDAPRAGALCPSLRAPAVGRLRGPGAAPRRCLPAGGRACPQPPAPLRWPTRRRGSVPGYAAPRPAPRAHQPAVSEHRPPPLPPPARACPTGARRLLPRPALGRPAPGLACPFSLCPQTPTDSEETGCPQPWV